MSLRQMTFTKSELACNVVAHGMHIQLIIQVIEHVLSMHATPWGGGLSSKWIPYSGKFSHGTNFRGFVDRSISAKIRTTKISM